jgi:hypothetical protein
MGNAAQYQASVNSVSGDQYLYLDANGRGPPAGRGPRLRACDRGTHGAALHSGQFHEIRQIARKSLIFYGAIDVVRAAKSLIFGR